MSCLVYSLATKKRYAWLKSKGLFKFEFKFLSAAKFNCLVDKRAMKGNFGTGFSFYIDIHPCHPTFVKITNSLSGTGSGVKHPSYRCSCYYG